MTQQPNVRLILPSPNDPSDPANLQALLLWANNFVVNKILPGGGVSLETQSQAQGAGAEGTGLVKVNAPGYASLTGPGQTQSPGDLTQMGGFTVDDAAGDGITLDSAGIARLEGATAAVVYSSGGAVVIEADGPASGIGISAPGGTGFELYTASGVGGLPSVPLVPAWGWTQDGKLYFYPVPSGPWTLVASSSSSPVSPATTVTGPDAFGAAAVVGTSLLYARADHDHGLPANPVTLAKLESLFTANLQILMGTGSGTGVLIDLLAALEREFGAAGQLILGSGAGTGGLLNIGTTGQVLTVVGGTAAWATPAAGVSPATSVTGPDALGTAAVVGTSTNYARQDHDHGLNTAATLGLMTTAVYDPAAIAQQVVGTTATQTITNKRITRRVSSTAGPGATPSMDTDNFDVFAFTALAAAITSMTTNLTGTPVAGDMILVELTDNGTARAITWGASFEASTVSLPTTTTISTLLTVLFKWNTATSKWRCLAVA